MYEVGEKIYTGITTYTVLAMEVRNKSKYCTLSCSICSEDRELWPEGSIRGLAYKLKGSNRHFCGCALKPNWKDWQYLIKAKRVAETRGLVCLGFSEEFKGASTKLKLVDKQGLIYDDCSLNSFINKGIHKNGLKPRKDLNTILTKLSGKFDDMENYIICLNEKEVTYTCKICSEDSYEGIKRVFTNNLSAFSSGKRACRCSKAYRWSAPERRLQISNLLREVKGTLHKYVHNTKAVDCVVEWVCELGHKNTDKLPPFLRKSAGCYCCKNTHQKFGFYPMKAKVQDYLYLVRFEGADYFKVGRSFKVSTRFKQIEIRSGLRIADAVLFTGTHQEVYDKEQEILDSNKSDKVKGYGSGELLALQSYDTILNSIDNLREVEVDIYL